MTKCLAARFVIHHVDQVGHFGAFLYVVGQVEVAVMKQGFLAHGLCRSKQQQACREQCANPAW